MRMRAPRSTSLLAAVLTVAPAALAAQGAVPADSAAFVEQARATARAFADPAAAVRAGFRRLGPDFPGMGQHWVHPGRIVSRRIDARSPAALGYATRADGSRVLVGIAYALPLGPAEAPPAEPFGPGVWHDHTGTVDEEMLLLGHAGVRAGDMYEFRLAMVHVWTGLENPDGILAQNNWALPFWRHGLSPHEPVSRGAARAVSLAHDGRAFYDELLRNVDGIDADQRARLASALDLHATRAESLIAAQREGRDVAAATYETVWYDFWIAVRDAVPAETWAMLSKLVEGD